jgi:FkbM family methyltransferase
VSVTRYCKRALAFLKSFHVIKDQIRKLIPRSVRNNLRAPTKTFHWFVDHCSYLISGPREYQIRSDWKLLSHPYAYHNAYGVHVTHEEGILEMDEFVSRCTEGMILFDIGSHFGIFSLAALKYGGEKHARVFAFDPSPMAEHYLLANARLNGYTGQVTFHRIAVGSCDKEEFLVPHGIVGAGYFSASDAAHHGQSERQKVLCRSIDSLVAETSVAPTHVKIDVEGFEDEVLRGGQTFLKTHSPVLFLEIHNQLLRNRSIDPHSVLDLVSEYGFSRITCLGRCLTFQEITEFPVARLVCEKLR